MPSRITKAGAAVFLLLGCGCGYRYHGDGEYHGMRRQYNALAYTQGFVITLPGFEPAEDQSRVYHLGKLPQYNYTIYFDLMVGKFPKPPSPEEEVKAAEAIPVAHKLTCELVDRTSGRVLGRVESPIRELPTMQNHQFARKCVFNLFQTPTREIREGADLELRLNYSIAGEPVKQHMAIFVSMDAPYA